MKHAIIWIVSICVLMLLVITLVFYMQRESATPYLYEGTLSARKVQDKYIIKIAQMGEKEKYIYFNDKREILKKQGINPIKIETIQIYTGMKYAEVVQKYGEPHADTGSGFYLPAYITEDGYLISFIVENDIVGEVIKQDLLTHNTGR